MTVRKGWRTAGEASFEPEAPALRVFVHSFYSQGSDERRNASSELFFEQALAFFGHRGEPITQADEQGRTLAGLLVEQHSTAYWCSMGSNRCSILHSMPNARPGG